MAKRFLAEFSKER